MSDVDIQDIVWVRWYKIYADGVIPTNDEHYNYQWYKRGNRTITELHSCIEMDLEETIELYNESEHYRCFRWEFITEPPSCYIDDTIANCKRSIIWNNQMIELLQSYGRTV